MDISELNELYREAEDSHSELFAEQRSNILLVSGNHYAKRGSKFWNTLRKNDKIDKQQRIRLTKNHLHKIAKTYVNNLMTLAPGVGISPRNESELSDQKAAELNNSVWFDIKERHKLKQLFRSLAHDFIEVGEGVLKIFFDPSAGKFLGHEPVMDEEGMPVIGEDGQPVTNAVFTGDVTFERIMGFNLLSDPNAKSREESRYDIYRKMVSIKDLKAQFSDDEEKLGFIQESSKQTYQVFDGTTAGYKNSSGLVMVREYYFKPDSKWPNGYYYIATESGVLYEGEIPRGIYPIHYVGFDQVPTYGRSYSIIKQLRPYQAEVNRSASKIAEHQITLGDDKLVLLNGGGISPGGTAHGVKAVKVTGSAPTVMPGRNGEQFVGYMNSQIAEMYQVANVVEDTEQVNGQLDPYAMLFRSIREKKKFSIYAEKWQEFYIECCKTTLTIAKAYFDANWMIPVFGKKEIVNIEEWKKTEDICYQITLEAQSEDVESKMGRQLSLNHIVQYAGQNLAQSDLGKLIRSMPYVNKEQLFSDLTIDYDNVTNDILSLDRGEFVPAQTSDNHDYYIRRLSQRMKQADFKYLPPQVQQMYQAKLTQHEQISVQQKQEAAALQAGFIPTGGYLVACDLYVPDARDPTKMPRRARIPFESLQWLLKRLDAQGTSQATLGTLPPSAIGEMMQMGLGQQPPMGQPPMGGPPAVSQQMLNASAQSMVG